MDFEVKEFKYELRYGGKNYGEIIYPTIVVPKGLRMQEVDSPIVSILDLMILPEDENGNVINFSSVEEAQDWIDTYGDKCQFVVKNGNELHAIRNDFILNELYTSVFLTDDVNKSWSVRAYTDDKAYYFTRDSLEQLNEFWSSNSSDAHFRFANDGTVYLHDDIQDLVLPLKEENGVYKFPVRWNWEKVNPLTSSYDWITDTDLEINRIRELLRSHIENSDGSCPGFAESTIASDNKYVSSLVNIRRMDIPRDYLYDFSSEGRISPDSMNIDALNSWGNVPIFENDLQAVVEAVELGFGDGIYDFSEWEDILYDVDDDLKKALDEIADDGPVIMTRHNTSVLRSLGLTEKDLDHLTMTHEALLRQRQQITATPVANDLNNDFQNYCIDKKSVMDMISDNQGRSYQPLLRCKINGMPDCSIVYIQGQENALCWVDGNGNTHIEYNNAPDVFAANMAFDQIDERFYDQLIANWDGLMMNEQIELYRNRDRVSEAISDMIYDSGLDADL